MVGDLEKIVFFWVQMVLAFFGKGVKKGAIFGDCGLPPNLVRIYCTWIFKILAAFCVHFHKVMFIFTIVVKLGCFHLFQ